MLMLNKKNKKKKEKVKYGFISFELLNGDLLECTGYLSLEYPLAFLVKLDSGIYYLIPKNKLKSYNFKAIEENKGNEEKL